KGLYQRRHIHRHLLSMLEKAAPDVRDCYRELISALVVRREPLTEDIWNNKWRAITREIAESLACDSISNAEADAFLSWGAGVQHSTATAPKMTHDNIYRYPISDPKVRIRVGSIHSVKGETHAATLVLETFYYQHNLEQLLKWLCGE